MSVRTQRCQSHYFSATPRRCNSDFINNSKQLNMFWALILPIFRNTRLCVTACGIMHPRCCRPVTWKRSFQATGLQYLVCMIPQAVTHRLVLLKMGRINAQNMLSCLELLINRHCCIYLVFISFISIMHGQTNIIRYRQNS